MRVNRLVVEVQAVQPGARRFEIEPSEMYPVVLTDLQNAVKTNRVVSAALETYKTQAAQLDPEAWKLATVPRGELSSPAALIVRSRALELARRWFTEHLHQFIDHAPLELHILKDKDWRL